MKDPLPVNRLTTEEVRAQGWVAEARDADGHLVSAIAFLDEVTTNENIMGLGVFVSEYETDCIVTIFTDTLATNLTK